ncbi:MAG TPA: tRNA (adenosine(37)-N6)-threonylcarbamoyltransferase complex transferase subunit TsaD [Nannocystaceae bacterium]|nr:tRNA (adenosine(37)-N6)-threonylcarbamoyltransferase complex transferase subunit TsaD [Nannocystaceae bacterium]
MLAIESSCDETACAVVDDLQVRSSVVRTQIEVHGRFGGVVPELASRHHLGAIAPVIEVALAEAGITDLHDLDALAVTEGPGLVGALLVGVQAARGLALGTNLPLFGVHHMEGHLFSACLGDAQRESVPFQPHVALLVSGGHTELVVVEGLGRYRVLGATRDDAAGEAFDKASKLLGLGYPGGPVIDRLAQDGNPKAFAFPRGMAEHDNFEFSFSGLKTALLVRLEKHGQPQSRAELCDLCASYRAAIVDVLVRKARRAVAKSKLARLHVVGGVAANRGLRAAAEQAGQDDGFAVVVPPIRYCGDNAAMIGAAAAARVAAGLSPSVELHTSLAIDDLRMRVP